MSQEITNPIRILVASEPPDRDHPADGEVLLMATSVGEALTHVKTVSADKLKMEMTKFCDQMHQVFVDVKGVGGFELEEVTLGIELSAQGGITLIASGSAKASIQLKFKRPSGGK